MTDDLARWPVEYERDVRALDAPPSDGLAECVVLFHRLMYPATIPTLDLAPLLTYPEHRELWACLQYAHAHAGTTDRREFYRVWLHRLQERHPKHWQHYLDLILSVVERQGTRAVRDCDDSTRRHILADHFHEYDWWLARLKRIAEARAVIKAASEIAAAAWQVPDRTFDPSSATAILERSRRSLAGVTRPPSVWDMDDL